MSCDFDFRRDLRTLKLSVGNKSRPKGSIAERYVANECLIFCARYLPGVETKENRSSRNNDDGEDGVRPGVLLYSSNEFYACWVEVVYLNTLQP